MLVQMLPRVRRNTVILRRHMGCMKITRRFLWRPPMNDPARPSFAPWTICYVHSDTTKLLLQQALLLVQICNAPERVYVALEGTFSNRIIHIILLCKSSLPTLDGLCWEGGNTRLLLITDVVNLAFKATRWLLFHGLDLCTLRTHRFCGEAVNLG